MKILLVEDDSLIAGLVSKALQAEGYNVEHVLNGEDGYLLLKRNKYDGLILDIMLPGMNGREICRKLREEGSRVPIVMLTALGSTQDIVRGLRFGADEYVTKPFDFKELLARLGTVIRRSCGETAVLNDWILTVDDLVFDRDALSLKRGATPIELTSMEYGLLELLMSQVGKVVTRTRILQNVWGLYTDPQTNIVEVYIRRLRVKIAPNGEPELIRTIRGRGYRMIATKGP
ncbi:response regulator transcription factor [Exilibacterium tricleocarpae]|uniref:Response regulator transcription factor n=1 Tax=Exilibacterium tricleocarpae TaxID=2591008 RepID=A0A545U4F7_9GAMM|nr:response regulator transcription factor [Exilibacterium tricleocarpae]TQV84283.1 response regulator transcription factor [Exilibacterium tricleocarpae]